MGEKKNRKAAILVAEASATVGESVRAVLRSAGYKVTLVQEGLAALEKLVKSPPDCLVAAQTLSDVGGSQLCGIVKDGLEELFLPVVLYRVDSRDGSELTGYAPADAEVNLADGLDALVTAVGELLGNAPERRNRSAEEAESAWKSSRDGVATNQLSVATASQLSVAKTLDKNMESYTILKVLYQVATGFSEPADLVAELLRLVRRLFGCEVAALSVNQQPARFYHSGSALLTKEDFKDFSRVCREDFQSGLPAGKARAWEAISAEILDGVPEESRSSHEKLSSYRYFMLLGENYIGGLHIASPRQGFFSRKVEQGLNFFAEHCALFLERALHKVRQQQESARLRATLSKFIPQEIIDGLVREDSQTNLLANELRRVAILCCDIRNFTGLCENTRPEQVVAFLNSYFTTMVNIIKKHGGSVDKFIGDAVMAIFGAPVGYEDNERRAVDAALEMRQALSVMQEHGRRYLGLDTVDYGIGIHCGDVVVGNIGCEDKTNYTVIGDSVNIAFRLEGVSKFYHAPIIVSQTVRDAMDDRYNFDQLDTVNVKGKSVEMPIYRLDVEELPADYRANYRKALDLYYAGAWGRAAEYFDRAHGAMEGGSAAVMARRCREFAVNPPERWDGTFVFNTK